ncbi:MAG TPA: hypothetical protein VHM19_17035 [Polyangiales bacterium]|jgi:hypothetical protein|nr:hypothetical protein [Polyangiales bacterium]
MANKKKSLAPKDPAAALAQIETPQIKWTVIAQIAGGFALLWVTAFIAKAYVGWWSVGVVGVLTLVAIGFGIYVWRMTAKQRAIVDIMKMAADPAGRERALEQLGAGADNDAMKAIAKAQLLISTDPAEALRTLEAIDLKKAPAMVQDEVRSQLAMMYLYNNRVRDARTLADELRLDRQPNAKAKAFYAAVMAEAMARTNSADEAKKLLDTYSEADPAYGEVRAMLLRAQIFTSVQLKKRGLAKKAMETLAQVEPGALTALAMKGMQPEIIQLAKQTLAEAGYATKVKMKRSP